MTAVARSEEATGPTKLVLLVRIAIVVIAVLALLSPVYAALRGSTFLNQPPPPYYGVNAGTPPAAGAGSAGTAHKTAGFGGC